MRKLPVIILLIALAGCSSNDRLPSGILKKEKMQAVFWDVIQAQAFTSHFIKKDSANLEIENAKLQQQIFAIHKISKEDFLKSYNYYAGHTELMRTLLDSITSKAEREKYTNLYSKPALPQKVRISLMPLPDPPPLKVIPMPIPSLASPSVSPSTVAPILVGVNHTVQFIKTPLKQKPSKNKMQKVMP